jgi:hypothetical protein
MARLFWLLALLSGLFLGAVSAAQDIVFRVRVLETLVSSAAATVAEIDVAAPAAASSLALATNLPDSTFDSAVSLAADMVASFDDSQAAGPSTSPAPVAPPALLARADAADPNDRWKELTIPADSNVNWTSYVESLVKERAGPLGKDPVTLSISPEFDVFRGQILDVLGEPLRQERIKHREGWLNKQYSR